MVRQNSLPSGSRHTCQGAVAPAPNSGLAGVAPNSRAHRKVEMQPVPAGLRLRHQLEREHRAAGAERRQVKPLGLTLGDVHAEQRRPERGCPVEVGDVDHEMRGARNGRHAVHPAWAARWQ